MKNKKALKAYLEELKKENNKLATKLYTKGTEEVNASVAADLQVPDEDVDLEELLEE